MKRLLIAVGMIAFLVLAVYSADELPEAKPGDRLFRLDGFGRPTPWPKLSRMPEVQLPKPKTIAQAEHEAAIAEIIAESKRKIDDAERKAKRSQERYDRGSDWFGWGMFALIVGAALTFYLKAYKASFIGALIAIGGIGAVGRGAWEMETAEKHWIITACCVGVAVFVGASFMLRKEGVELGKLFTGKYFKGKG